MEVKVVDNQLEYALRIFKKNFLKPEHSRRRREEDSMKSQVLRKKESTQRPLKDV